MDSITLTTLRRIAEAAGIVIMEVYRSDFTHALKADNSPVTEADLRADVLIRRELARAFPGVPVWSEESEESGEPPASWPAFFLVDPLDGTKEFLQRRGEFTVNIAWVEGGAPRAGVVHAPALGITWWGAPGVGAWRQGPSDPVRCPGDDGGGDVVAPGGFARVAGESVPIHVTPGPDPGVLRVLASRSHRDGRLEGWLQRLSQPLEVVQAGSSLKFCRIADGAADLYPRFGPTSQWDTAAGQAVLEGAGGCVTDMDGIPLRYGRERPVINPSFVAARGLALWHPRARAALRRHS